MKQIKGGVAAAKGFYAAAAAAGIKYQGRDDMALIYSEVPCACAGTFTSNVVKAAPVLWDRKIVRESDKTVQAVIINSGIANACTGEQGMRICRAEAEAAGNALSIDPEGVLVASTGVIGMQIDTDKIGEVVGKQGKVINRIIEECGVKIDISEDGTVSRMRIDVLGSARVVQQIILQLRNQVSVIEVTSRRL